MCQTNGIGKVPSTAVGDSGVLALFIRVYERIPLAEPLGIQHRVGFQPVARDIQVLSARGPHVLFRGLEET